MLPSHSVPPDASWFPRQLDGLREALREGLASVARSLSPQVDYLMGQTTIASVSDYYWEKLGPGSSVIQFDAHDSAMDATITFRPGSVGRVAIQAGGTIGARTGGNAIADMGIGIELLAGATVIREPKSVDGGLLSAQTLTDGQFQSLFTSICGMPITVDGLDPAIEYTARCRRAYRTVNGSGASPFSRVTAYGTSLSVTKLGM